MPRQEVRKSHCPEQDNASEDDKQVALDLRDHWLFRHGSWLQKGDSWGKYPTLLAASS